MTNWSIKYNNDFTDVVDAEEYAWTCDRILREWDDLYPFKGDSRDYWVLHRAAESVADIPGLFCEVGFRKGGGTKAIMDAVIKSGKERTCIAVDPFGSIPFEGMEGEYLAKTEYSNAMQKDTLEKMYRFVAQFPNINFVFLPLEDIEFFKRFADGVPVYSNSTKEIMNEYALVHLDGPHTLEITMKETLFFLDKMPVGGMMVFDDVEYFYNHGAIKDFLEKNGWEQIEKTKVKASYKKVK